MPVPTPYGDWPDETKFYYRRRGRQLDIVMMSMTNHELREIMIGLWSRLEDADKRDHINELTAYLSPYERISGIAQMIATATGD